MEANEGYFESIWHLAQFKPNCAMIAKRNLAKQGFEVFLPLETQTRIARSKFIEEIKPFFPGYLFVGTTDKSGSVYSIRSTFGVSQLVRFGTMAANVPAQVVEELRSRCDSEGVMGRNVGFKNGETVRVAHGAFSGLVGEVQRTAPDRRVWLLLDMMGQKTKVSVAQSVLMAKSLIQKFLNELSALRFCG